MAPSENGHLVVSFLIIFFSSALFLYWFRYICVLILRERGGSEVEARIAGGERLRFLDVQRQLAGNPPPASLEPLWEAIGTDYRLLSNRLRTELPTSSLETRLLRIDFLLMSAWYRIMRPISGERAVRALSEMSSIVGYLASEV